MTMFVCLSVCLSVASRANVRPVQKLTNQPTWKFRQCDRMHYEWWRHHRAEKDANIMRIVIMGFNINLSQRHILMKRCNLKHIRTTMKITPSNSKLLNPRWRTTTITVECHQFSNFENSKWRTIAILKSPYFGEKLFDFDEILYAAADWQWTAIKLITKTQNSKTRYGGGTPY